MSKINEAISNLHEIDMESIRRRNESSISDVAKFIVAISYMIFVVSFNKYEITGICSMFLFLIMSSIVEDISIIKGMIKAKYILALLFIAGIANPFFDRNVVYTFENIMVTSGMISMFTLFLKGFLTVCCAYFLMIQIGIEGICNTLYKFHLPQSLITMILLMYRYIIVLLKEIERMLIAYKLRAPNQKGIHVSAWGSFAGLLLTRSVDRASEVYDCMMLRGYDGSIYVNRNGKNDFLNSILYVIGWGIVFVVLRFVPVFTIVGNIILNR